MKESMREDYHEFLEIYHFTPSPFEKAGAAWPIRLGYNQAKSNYHIGPRTSPYYYLLFVLAGEGTFIQNQQSYTLRPNDMFCLIPQATHEYYTHPDRPLSKIFIAFDGRLAPHLLDRIGLTSQSPHASGSLTPEIISIMFAFKDLVSTAEATSTDLARLSYFLQVFDILSRRSTKAHSEEKLYVPWLQKGREYIDIHYTEGITVEGVSAYAGVERTHFTKQFRKYYGVTPIQYIQSLKMDEAKQLLKETSYTLSEIASSLGYPDLFSFSKAFKKMEGLSPSRFRTIDS